MPSRLFFLNLARPAAVLRDELDALAKIAA
jgi:hypothetical protein